MLVIRLARRGSKKRPFYDIVVTEKTSARDGRFIEKLGFVNPIAAGAEEPVRLDLERIEHWVKQGAQMSDTVKQTVKRYKKNQEAA